MVTISELREAVQAAKKRMQDEGKEALKAAFAEFFDANPGVEAVRWEQYTPYFNDGEPCEFGVGDFYVQLNAAARAECGVTSEDSDHGDGYFHEWAFRSTYNRTPTPAGLAMAAALDGLEGAVRDDDLMLATFGDHVRVTATRQGFDVEEYEHD